MDIIAANGIVLPLFLTWFIPVSLRDPVTGEFKGFYKKEFLLTVTALIFIESALMFNQFGIVFPAVLRIFIGVSSTLFLAFLFLKLTNKKAFGKEFEFKRNLKE
jgi:hypothetical protein